MKSDFRNWNAYQGPLGEVVCNDRYFFAWKDGCLIGASKTHEEAMEAFRLERKAKGEVRPNEAFSILFILAMPKPWSPC